MYVEGILVATEDASTVVGFVLRNMCEHRILLLQLTRTPREVWYGMYDGYEGLGLCFGRRYNVDGGLFGWLHLGRTSWDVIHDIQRCLWHNE